MQRLQDRLAGTSRPPFPNTGTQWTALTLSELARTKEVLDTLPDPRLCEGSVRELG